MLSTVFRLAHGLSVAFCIEPSNFTCLLVLLGLSLLQGMMPGINDMLARVSAERGLSWDEKLKELKSKGQWHVEVY